MHVNRQHNEHLVLIGKSCTGRYQCVRLATFALMGQVYCFKNIYFLGFSYIF